MKFVIFSHAHPGFSKGGGELAAWFHFQGLKSAGHDAWFMARAYPKRCNPDLDINFIGDNQFLIASETDFYIGTSLKLHQHSSLVQWFTENQPDVVHFHHYVHLGVELIGMVRRVCPGTRIVLTLHELGAVCANHGQMVKSNGALCYKSGPRECVTCFPDIPMDDFFLRERYIKSFFKHVDLFISPSEFVKKRYIQWGVPREKFYVLENGLPCAPRVPIRHVEENGVRANFSFFGQIIPYKGLDIVLSAFQLLPDELRPGIRLNIYGSRDDTWFPEYDEKISSLLSANSDVARYHGPYEQHEMAALMAETDWVIMGSIWWENSPLVIQEAYIYSRPVICSDIGGMAEKVHDGKTGKHFRTGDPAGLADVVKEVTAFTDDTYQSYVKNLPVPWGMEKMTKAYLDILSIPG